MRVLWTVELLKKQGKRGAEVNQHEVDEKVRDGFVIAATFVGEEEWGSLQGIRL